MEFASRYPGYTPDNASINTSIEQGVKPLCNALNSLPGVFTIWSCEGHPDRHARPYVVFVTDHSTAFGIHCAIQARPGLGLRFNWGVTASFREDGSLQYVLEPHDYRVSVGSWRGWKFARRLDHGRLLKDILRLAELVA